MGGVRKRRFDCTVEPVLSGPQLSWHPLLSGHLERSRGCPLNRGFTVFQFWRSKMRGRQTCSQSLAVNCGKSRARLNHWQGVTVFWVSPSFGYPRTQNTSVLGIPLQYDFSVLGIPRYPPPVPKSLVFWVSLSVSVVLHVHFWYCYRCLIRLWVVELWLRVKHW